MPSLTVVVAVADSSHHHPSVSAYITGRSARAPRAKAVSWREKFSLLWQVSPMVILFSIVTGTIYLGGLNSFARYANRRWPKSSTARFRFSSPI
ncbi:MAG: hypothetical protein ACXWKP_19355 [Bradyrhizobium sp.]